MKQNAPCKLCSKRAKLIRKSHIVPEFMYKPLYDETRRMILAPINGSKDQPQYFQQGFYDKYILCESCDTGLISKLERYSKAILYGEHKLPNPPVIIKGAAEDGLPMLLIRNIDYTKFKLFVLSFLWRAHISNNPFFKHVDIGNNESKIRKMLIEGNAGKREDYPIYVALIQNKHGETIRMFPTPTVYKSGQDEYAAFIINGCLFLICLCTKPTLEVFTKPYFRETNEIDLPILAGDIAFKVLRAFGLSEEIVSYFIHIYRDVDNQQ